MTIQHLSVTLLLLALPRLGTAQTPTDTLRQLDSAWARSYATNDTVLASKLFDDNLIVTGADGRLKGKRGEIAESHHQHPCRGAELSGFRVFTG